MQEVRTERAPRPVGPYSQALVAQGFVFCSGQIALDPSTGQLVEGGIREQTRRVLSNLSEILEAAGSGLERVVRVSAYLSDLGDFQAFNEVYQEFFRPPYPARTTVEVKGLPRGAKVEIDVIALLR
jgi:2-iminobutanoate/2-iminopropanoate deaminase